MKHDDNKTALLSENASPTGTTHDYENTTKKQKLYRVSEIALPNGMFPISASSWWAGVKSGVFPQPVSLGPRITVWRAADLEQLAKHGVGTSEKTPGSSNGGAS